VGENPEKESIVAGKKKGGRPFGENTNSGKGLMTKYTKATGNKPSMKIKGRSARSNSVQNLKGRASSNSYGGPNSKR
jgi:hypothetical protein